MRPGPRVLVLIIPTVIFVASVVASYGRSRAEEPTFDPTHPVWHWQGPFEYVREFHGGGPGCSFNGRQVVQATVICAGTDLQHLRCEASGTASHQYREQIDKNGAPAQREDAGSLGGKLKAEYDTQVIKGVDLFRLSVGTSLPVQYRRTGDGAATNGTYVLDVSGSTSDLVFAPQDARLERRRVQPIYEPGPTACGVQGRFNGTETVSMRLLPTD